MPPTADPRAELRADCSRCVGLCCVAPAFVASADFAIDKPAGVACPHLQGDSRCRIHDRLRPMGFPGCAVFDCLGAGQRVTQSTFGGADWREGPDTAARMFAAFGVMRQLHELHWHLADALDRPAAHPVHADLRVLRDRVEERAALDADRLAEVDAGALRAEAGPLLARASAMVRAGVRPDGPSRRGADLMGRDLRRADLRAADLRGAYLIGADLRAVDLTAADLLGADLRAADVRGALLADALFVTQPQVEAANGDAGTTIPAALARPSSWR